MTDQPEAPIVQDAAAEPEYCPPALIELGTLGELTQAGPNLTLFDGVEGHS